MAVFGVGLSFKRPAKKEWTDQLRGAFTGIFWKASGLSFWATFNELGLLQGVIA